MSNKEIENIFNVNDIGELFKKNHCTTKDLTGLRYRKYNVKDNYFEKIDSPEKAYILGVLYTDGYLIIEGNCTKRIGLDVKDKDWLEGINNLLTDAPLYLTAKPDIFRMKITSPKMYNDLIQLGCTSQKTFTIKFPTEDQVPKKYLSQFILGMWDGDGSIGFNYRKYKNGGFWQYQMTFTKTKELIEGIQHFLGVDHFKLYQRHSERNNNNYTLQISGNRCVKQALQKIYENAPNICLKRKYENYLAIINDSRVNP